MSPAELKPILDAVSTNFYWNLFSTIGLIVALVIVGVFLHRRNKELKDRLDDQKDILENTNRFISLFDLDKLERYVKISEETITKEKEMEIQEMVAEYEKTIEEGKSSKRELAKEMTAMIWASIAFEYAPAAIRESALKAMPESTTKAMLTEISSKLREEEKKQGLLAQRGFLHPNILAWHRAKALREASSEEDLQQNSENQE